ncbi:MAG TPA: phosphoglycerol geranylgeranyltransferase [Methanomicrobia archaeon]|nr:phosphoglycerol geranylgeranyltransferase [Methanomicrobia archaeon]
MSPTPKKPWSTWKHVTKLDPDKPISVQQLKRIADSGTDALMISGTQNITDKKVARLTEQLRAFDIPKILEPATPEAVLEDDVDFIFVPLVLNTGDLQWIVGKHKNWIQHYAVNWDKVYAEAYIVLNPESAVAQLTRASTLLTPQEVCAYAQYAEKYLGIPIVYVEYSGKYGDPAIVKAVNEVLSHATLFYGGGITSHETALEMSRYADVIVVGNIIYEDFERYLETIP